MDKNEEMNSREALKFYGIEQSQSYDKLKETIMKEVDAVYLENRNLKNALNDVLSGLAELKDELMSSQKAADRENYYFIGIVFSIAFGLAMTFLAVFAV